jgi:hypothetical protein
MVAFFVEVGLLLLVVPWSSYWERNYFGTLWPALRPWLVSNYVRGAVSGLGLVNLLAGIADLLPVVLPRVTHTALDDEPEESS